MALERREIHKQRRCRLARSASRQTSAQNMPSLSAAAPSASCRSICHRRDDLYGGGGGSWGGCQSAPIWGIGCDSQILLSALPGLWSMDLSKCPSYLHNVNVQTDSLIFIARRSRPPRSLLCSNVRLSSLCRWPPEGCSAAAGAGARLGSIASQARWTFPGTAGSAAWTLTFCAKPCVTCSTALQLVLSTRRVTPSRDAPPEPLADDGKLL